MVEQRIRQNNEGEKPSEVIRGYVRLRYGLYATAKAMGIHHVTCKRLADRFGIKFPPYRELNDSCKRGRTRTVTNGMTMNQIVLGYLVDRMKEGT